MNFNKWLSSNGVTHKYELTEDIYENLENIIGKQFWICDYRLNDKKDNRPIRRITPRLVQVFSNDNLPNNKRVYYSPIHFREVKNRKIKSTIIAPFDNTGYRGRTGLSVNIFNSESDCRKHFNKQCDKAIKEYKEELNRRTEEINNRIMEIQELKNTNVVKP